MMASLILFIQKFTYTQPVKHITEGLGAWRTGFIGLMIRQKGILLSGIGVLITAGKPWWWNENSHFPESIELGSNDILILFSAIIIILGSLFVAGLFYLRNRTIRSLNIKHRLHNITHNLRDKQTELNQKLSLLGNNSEREALIYSYMINTLKLMCDNIELYFKALVKDDSIGVAIRLASLEDEATQVVFKTYARSNGMNPNRAIKSESIPINQGTPKYLHEKGLMGIVIYNDIKAAIEQNLYHPTHNDKNFPNEIMSMMVAPMNAWSGKSVQQEMIGLLCITSRRQEAFSEKNFDSTAFLSDLTAYSIANILNNLTNYR